MITNELIASGRVQGVGFRYMTVMVAKELGVFGTVQNLMNGDVKIIAQADNKTMNKFIAKIKASPTPSGYVSHLEITPLNYKESLHSFRVIG